MPRGATGANGWIEFLNRAVHRARVGRGGPRRARRPAARALPARARPAGRGAWWPACSPRRCSAGWSWSSTSRRWRWPATTSCRPCSWPTPSSSTTGRRARRGTGERGRHAALLQRGARGARRPGRAGAGHRHARDRERAPQRRRRRRPAAVRGRHRRARPQRDGVGVPRRRRRRAAPGDAGRRRPEHASARGRVLVGAIVAQGTLGYVQYAAGVPEAMVAAHVLGLGARVGRRRCGFHLALTEPVPAGEPAPSATRRPSPSRPRRRDGRPRSRRPVEVDEPVDDTRTEPDVPVDRPRVERPDQPHVLRELRAPEAVRVPEGEGRPPDAAGARGGPGGGGQRAPGDLRAARVPAARARALGDHAARHADGPFLRRRRIEPHAARARYAIAPPRARARAARRPRRPAPRAARWPPPTTRACGGCSPPRTTRTPSATASTSSSCATSCSSGGWPP